MVMYKIDRKGEGVQISFTRTDLRSSKGKGYFYVKLSY